MEYSEIKKIMEDMEKSKLAELSIEFPDGTKVSVKNEKREEVKYVPVQNEIKMPEEQRQENSITGNEVQDNLKVVTSPMVGTFYAKPAPDSNPFVEVGMNVKKGDVLCIIEAMKLMNEIESEYDGEIVEVLVKDGSLVEYGKPLFKIKN